MRIGLVTDTHIPAHAKALPKELFEVFRGVDLILHGGDIYAVSVLDELSRIAPVLAAWGDDDYGDTVKDERVKGRHILKLEGLTLWLVHERPYVPMSSSFFPTWWENRLNPEENKNGKPDIIVFGHEHRSTIQRTDGVLLVNSGSPTFLEYRTGPGSVGILEISSGAAEARIVQL